VKNVKGEDEMKRRTTAMVMLFVLLTTALIYGQGVDLQEASLYQPQDVMSQSQLKGDDSVTPTEILHHTCGRGGTSCYSCYHNTLIKACGCVYKSYYCCCGKSHSFEIIYCPTHRF